MSISISFYGAGGRKRSKARVFIIPVKTGGGRFTVNKKDVVDYFPELAAVSKIYEPLNLLGLQDLLDQYDIKANVKGGGKTGQRDAICLGLSKALVMLESKKATMPQRIEGSDVEGDSNDSLVWRRQLRKAGMLTRDSRKVERKLYGLHKARKRAPFVRR